MKESSKTVAIIIIAIFLIFIAIMLYWIWKQKQLYGDDWSFFDGDIDPTRPPYDQDGEEPPDTSPDEGEGDMDPYTPPGYQVIRLDKVTSYSKSITFNFDKTYRANLLSGNLRPGGKVYTNVRIKYKSSPNGSWKHIHTVGGWPDGFVNFSTTINDDCAGIKFEAEQGLIPWLIGDRYIDEVHGEVMIEVGS